MFCDHIDLLKCAMIFCSFEVVKVIHDKILDMMGASRLKLSKFTIKVHQLKCVGFHWCWWVTNLIFTCRGKEEMNLKLFYECCVVRVITMEQGKRLADSWNALFVESSAKQNEVSQSRNAFKILAISRVHRG